MGLGAGMNGGGMGPKPITNYSVIKENKIYFLYEGGMPR